MQVTIASEFMNVTAMPHAWDSVSQHSFSSCGFHILSVPLFWDVSWALEGQWCGCLLRVEHLAVTYPQGQFAQLESALAITCCKEKLWPRLRAAGHWSMYTNIYLEGSMTPFLFSKTIVGSSLGLLASQLWAFDQSKLFLIMEQKVEMLPEWALGSTCSFCLFTAVIYQSCAAVPTVSWF